MIRRLLRWGALLALLAWPSAAHAANSAVYEDSVDDAVFPGVDVKRIALLYTDAGVVGIGVGTNLLVGGNRIAIHLDTDLNPATGWLGADYALFYEQYGVGQALIYGVWNGTAWQLGSASTLGYEPGPFGVNIVIHRSEIGSPTQGLRVFARGGHANVVGTGDTYSDWAPNSGSWELAFNPPTAVGGAGGGPAPAPAPPVASLAVAEARALARRGLRAHVGARASIRLRRCVPTSAVKVRCRASARRGSLVWKGKATVVERVANGTVTHSFAFRGVRVSGVCKRRSKGSAARCTRTVRW